MHRQWKLAAALVVAAMVTSGCWTYACIDDPGSTYARCTDQVDSIFFPHCDPAEEIDCLDAEVECDEVRMGTTCHDQGFVYDCGGEALYKYPCGDVGALVDPQ